MVIVAAQVAWRALRTPHNGGSVDEGIDDTPGDLGDGCRRARARPDRRSPVPHGRRPRGRRRRTRSGSSCRMPPEAGPTQVAAPPDSASVGGAFAYPADGSIVTTASSTARASTSVTASARAQASAEVAALSLFGGELTAELVTAHAGVSASPRRARGDTGGTGVLGLTVQGQPAGPGRVALGDWGYADAAGAHERAGDGARRQRLPRVRARAVDPPDGRARRAAGGHPDPRRVRGSRRAGGAGRAHASKRAARARATVTPGAEGSARAAGAQARAVALRAAGPHGAAEPDPPPHPEGLRLPGLRARVVVGHVRCPARDHRLAPRRGHLRAARRARSSPRTTASRSRSAGSRSAATDCGSGTTRATSSTTPTCPRSRRWPSTGAGCAPGTCSGSSATPATPRGRPTTSTSRSTPSACSASATTAWSTRRAT